MKNVTFNLLIEEIYQEYQTKYKVSLPKIDKVHFVSNQDFWAEFNASDLYNKKYELYIDSSLFDTNNKFIRQILFHEFTHLYDSLNYIEKTFDDYKKIMISYSEFHASQREMIERLEEVKTQDISLQTPITHIGILNLQSYMDQSYRMMCEDLKKMYNNDNEKEFFYNTSHIFYFYGYISALQKFKINYYYTLPIEFMLQLIKIEDTLIKSDNIDNEKVISSYIELEKSVIDQYKLNQILKKRL